MTATKTDNEVPSNASLTTSDDSLTPLHGPTAFEKQLQSLLSRAQRSVEILTSHLDPQLFSSSEASHLLSRLARRHRQTQVRILIKDPKPLFGRNHSLINLQQRLPSKILLRQLRLSPRNDNMGYVMADGKLLLFQHKEGLFEGYSNTNAAAQCKQLLEEFDELWQRQSVEVVELRQLML